MMIRTTDARGKGKEAISFTLVLLRFSIQSVMEMMDFENNAASSGQQLPKLLLFCNGAIRAMLVVIALFSFLPYLFWLPPILAGAGVPDDHFNPAVLWWFYPFPASLVLLWGHKRVTREPVLSRFSKTFWPIATAHYVALAVTFISFVFLSEKTPVEHRPDPPHGLRNFILAVVFCLAPTILSLPPFVFTIREMLRFRISRGSERTAQ